MYTQNCVIAYTDRNDIFMSFKYMAKIIFF